MPDVSKLLIVSDDDLVEDTGSAKFWVFFILFLIFLSILAFVAYIFLQQWYKKSYENYLFPNKNSLYNLLNYLGNQKKQGVKEKEMRKRLKKAAWML